MNGSSLQIERDLVYAKVHGKALTLDLYRHAQTRKKEPLIIWIHGGAWRQGDKNNPHSALMMLDRGYAVASISYRLSHEAIFPAQIYDCKAAIRWLRSHADDYGYDAERFGAWGASAGAHLAALLGTSGDVQELEGDLGLMGASSQVQAVCDWFGPSDFLRLNDTQGQLDHDSADSPESELIGGPIQRHPDLVACANPINYIAAQTPPFLIMHGLEDLIVPKNQSELLHAGLRKRDVDSTLVLLAGQGHGFAGEPLNGIIEQVSIFFDRVLKTDHV